MGEKVVDVVDGTCTQVAVSCEAGRIEKRYVMMFTVDYRVEFIFLDIYIHVFICVYICFSIRNPGTLKSN